MQREVQGGPLIMLVIGQFIMLDFKLTGNIFNCVHPVGAFVCVCICVIGLSAGESSFSP